MDSVLVLIAAPGSGAIDARIVEAASDLTGSRATWLAEYEALESPVTPSRQKPDLDDIVRNLPIDIAIVPAANRRKRLLIADMDSTMIGQECVDELGALAGAGEKIRVITARAMRGELDFEAALRERLALMNGLPESAIAKVLAERITFANGGRALVQTMKAHGAHTALVSGGFTPFTRHVAAHLGFDEERANDLIIENGRLAGKAREPILGKDAKLAALRDIASGLGLSTADAIAVGDGANDIPMLASAGLGVAIHAKPKVQEAAPLCINHGDLTALLYLQGYRRDAFAEQ